MRLLADQDVYSATVLYLRGLGHDVDTAAEKGMSRSEDADLLRVAQAGGRVLVTRDSDYGSLVFVQSFSDENQGVTRHPMSATWPLETLSTILFDDLGGKTLLTIKWAALNANEVELKTFADGHDGMRQGWGGTMEQLVAYVKEKK